MSNGNPAVPNGSGGVVTPNGTVTPDLPLQLENKWVKPVDPLEQLKSKAIDVDPQIIQQRQVQQPQPQQFVQTEPQSYAQPEQPQYNEQDPNAPPPGFKGNAFARMRILEREREQARRENDDLRNQLERIATLMESQIPQQEEEIEEIEEEPLNPLDRLAKQQEKILNKFEEQEKQEKADADLNAQMSEEQQANMSIKQYVAQVESVVPGVYQQAVAHLADVWMSEVLEDTPNITQKEALQAVAKKATDFKMTAHRRGENPGEAYIRRAALMGWMPPQGPNDPRNASRTHQASLQAPSIPQMDPRAAATEIVKAEAKRRSSMGSLSSMSGAAPQDPLAGLHLLPEKDRVRALMAAQRARPNKYRTIPLSETLAHKMTK